MIDNHRPSFSLSDNWPVLDLFSQENIPVPNSRLETPAPGPSSRFNPGYFAHLNDEMFEDNLINGRTQSHLRIMTKISMCLGSCLVAF
jgi:hypothetical protein